MVQHYDAIVIGSGPAGEGAAMQFSKNRRSVLVVERHDGLGGACTHRGTIPSKALRWAIFQMTEANQNPLFREAGVKLNLSFPELRRTAHGVIEKQVDLRRGFYDRNRVPVVEGQARLVGPHEVEVLLYGGGRVWATADFIVIATGSRPYRPRDVDFTHPRVFDSDTILGLGATPQSIAIYGAGVVGCEYTSMFRNLGVKVNLINTRAKLLEFLDDEIIDALSYHMRELGVVIRHSESYERIEPRDDGVAVYLASGKQIHTDIVLWANGRTGNSDGLGLEEIGIVADSRGYIPVNAYYQTALPHIYAAGDVVGRPSLASASYMQGRAAASHAVGDESAGAFDREFPTGIYTSPEISSLGRTERELTESRVPYELGHAAFKSLARGQITGHTVGMLKLLFHRETLQILGIHCFGANAAEIIHIGQAIMRQPAPANNLLYFIHTTFNYPTMAEAYRVAALNGYNRLR